MWTRRMGRGLLLGSLGWGSAFSPPQIVDQPRSRQVGDLADTLSPLVRRSTILKILTPPTTSAQYPLDPTSSPSSYLTLTQSYFPGP